MVDESNNQRNFRLSYYDKVGFRGIGEKVLIAIMKDDVIDKKKLENFCIRFPISSNYRLLLWKILLDILPIHQQSHKFVMLQRTEQYNDLHHALEVIRKIKNSTEISEVFLKMYLLEKGELCLDIRTAEWHANFIVIAQVVRDMFDSAVDCYWISVRLYHLLTSKDRSASANRFNGMVVNYLQKENAQLHNYLTEMGFFPNDTMLFWYKLAFAGVLQSDASLEKIWDILIGGGELVLAYVAMHVLLAFDRQLLHSKSLQNALDILNERPYSEEISSIVALKGIESWNKYEKII